MKKFKFSLATVLEVKRRREEALEKELALLMGRRAGLMADLAGLLKEHEELSGHQKDTRSAEKTVLAEEMWFQARRTGLLRQAEQKRGELMACEHECQAKRLQLLEAARETKVFEKLEENQKREYLLEANREEQGFLDELSQHQFSAKNVPAQPAA